MLYRLYIGANNKTKEVEKAKAIGVIEKYFLGFTILLTDGYWQGEPKPSIIAEVETDDSQKVKSLAKQLKKVLKQDEIGLATLNSMLKFV